MHQRWARTPYLQEFLVTRRLGWQSLDDEVRDDFPSASDVREDLYWYFVKSEPRAALLDLLRPQDLVEWVNSCVGEEYYSETYDRVEMARTILAQYGIPLSPDTEVPYSLDRFRASLLRIKGQLLQYEKDGDIPDGTLRGLGLDGWSELETLLRMTLVFWSHALTEQCDHEWLSVAIDDALKQQSLSRLVDPGFRSIEQFFQTRVPTRILRRRWEGENRDKRK